MLQLLSQPAWVFFLSSIMMKQKDARFLGAKQHRTRDRTFGYFENHNIVKGAVISLQSLNLTI